MPDTIKSIDVFHIPAKPDPEAWFNIKPYILVRVETSAGVSGWGEAHLLNHRERTLIAAIQDFAAGLIGTDAGAIRAVSHRAFEGFGEQRAGIEIYCAMAGIETALWDALGKSLGQPVHRLLGGTHHDEIVVYANIFTPHDVEPDVLAARALAHVEKGYRAIKAYPLLRGISMERGLAKLKAVREAIGPDIPLAVDLWRHADQDRAAEFSRRAEPYNLAWLEDPFAPVNAAALRSLREKATHPILTGETLVSRREFREMFEQQAVSLVNPDICATGILEMHAIAAMAEPFQIRVSPHNSNSMALGSAIMVQAAAGIANLGLCEYFPVFENVLDDFCEHRPVIEKGAFHVPSDPGVGLAFKESKMERFRVS
ncbi:MAG: mandelate racemase/muconate lactonizing enzyme family protein [Pseudomonadota bacterium]